MKHWYVLHTKPHKEDQVADHLQSRHIETYLPYIPVSTVNPRAARAKPYFPSYLFARADLAEVGVSLLQWTPGLRRLVDFGGQPAALPDNFVFEIRRRVEQLHASGGILFVGLEHGVPVKITSGPLAGYEAIFDKHLAGTERVRVLLQLVERHQHGRGARTFSPSLPIDLNVNSITKMKL